MFPAWPGHAALRRRKNQPEDGPAASSGPGAFRMCRFRVAPASAANKFASLSSSPRPLLQRVVAEGRPIGESHDAAQSGEG
jgi:hypothetical protein